MANCLIGLGSNVGDRSGYLQQALQLLGAVSQTKILAASSLHDTKPAGGPSHQQTFLNAAALLETSLSPHQLLAELHHIETQLGRIRDERWGPRTIDLDLLLYDQLDWESPDLTLPHPRMSFRRFVLEPAADIAATMVYPINGWKIERLLQHLNSTDRDIHLSPMQSRLCPDSPVTKLLTVLAADSGIQPIYRGDLKGLNAGSTPIRPQSPWRIHDFWPTQIAAEGFADDAGFDERLERTLRENVKPRLIVVWHPANAPILGLLDRIRRNRECPPMLWIPKVTLEQARQEVIAAMAAME